MALKGTANEPQEKRAPTLSTKSRSSRLHDVIVSCGRTLMALGLLHSMALIEQTSASSGRR